MDATTSDIAMASITRAAENAKIAGDSSATVLVDVTPYTFGTSALGELNGELYPYCFIPLIRKNTPSL